MDIWKHCLMSQRKFGGEPEIYYPIHRFLDSSKLFYWHAKHRLLLHNTYGIELACELFHDYIQNSLGRVILVRDIAAEHCKEDLDGTVPSLHDWLKSMNEESLPLFELPMLSDHPDLEAFVMRPYLRSGLRSSLWITCSDFGVSLAELCLGVSAAKTLAERLVPPRSVKEFLQTFRFAERWQYTPMHDEIRWLKEQEVKASRKFAKIMAKTSKKDRRQ